MQQKGSNFVQYPQSFMTKITQYKPHQSCRIDLDDGTKVLLSFGYNDIKLLQLGFLSIPKETLYAFPAQSYSNLLNVLGYGTDGEEVKGLSEHLVKAQNVSQLIDICKTLEEKLKV